jgi:urease accessory protein
VRPETSECAAQGETPAPGFVALPLMIWLSPNFPVGAFAYSHGIEWAVESGAITNADNLQTWITGLLHFGAAHSDSVLLAEAYRAAKTDDEAALRGANELALALAPSRERALESSAQGNAFVQAARVSWPCAALDMLKSEVPGDVAYAIALGTAASGHGMALGATLEAFALGFVANLVSAAVRLGPIGQSDGQRILAALVPDVRALATFAAQSTLDDLGSCAFASDIASMHHETQYSRLFRS